MTHTAPGFTILFREFQCRGRERKSAIFRDTGSWFVD